MLIHNFESWDSTSTFGTEYSFDPILNALIFDRKALDGKLGQGHGSVFRVYQGFSNNIILHAKLRNGKIFGFRNLSPSFLSLTPN